MARAYRRARVIAVAVATALIALLPETSGAQPLAPAQERALKPQDTFKECPACPEMVVVPAGSFTMGSPASEDGRDDNEGPQHQVTFAQQISVGKFAVTFNEWDACVADGFCNRYRPGDQRWGRGKRPVINVSWDDAQTYVAWLSHKTGKTYRLLSEAEREYVTRAGTTTAYSTGSSISTQQANYCANSEKFKRKQFGEDCRGRTVPVDSFQPNPWGLYQMEGNVREWTEDCWNPSYDGAPTDGSAWTGGMCQFRVARGGSWDTLRALRAAARAGPSAVDRNIVLGFRVARALIVKN